MNRVNLLGNITKDIELKETSSGVKYTRFSIAVRRTFKNEDGDYDTDFFNVIAWRKTAEIINEYFNKGSRIAISGKLQMSKYTDKDGNDRTSTEIVAEEIDFIDKKEEKEDLPTDQTGDEVTQSDNSLSDEVFADFGDSIEIDDVDVAF